MPVFVNKKNTALHPMDNAGISQTAIWSLHQQTKNSAQW